MQNTFLLGLALMFRSVAQLRAQPYLEIGLPRDAIRELVPQLTAKGYSLTVVYSDNTGARTLTGATYTDTSNMYVESCISFCSAQSTTYVYAGVEYGQECCTFYLIGLHITCRENVSPL